MQSPALAAGDFPLASCKGWSGTITEREGERGDADAAPLDNEHEERTMRPAPAEEDLCPIETEVNAALAWHNGDPRATIATLIDDLRHIKLQLALAEGAMSRGMTRGWRPTYERV